MIIKAAFFMNGSFFNFLMAIMMVICGDTLIVIFNRYSQSVKNLIQQILFLD
jgi:hypothetical protein